MRKYVRQEPEKRRVALPPKLQDRGRVPRCRQSLPKLLSRDRREPHHQEPSWQHPAVDMMAYTTALTDKEHWQLATVFACGTSSA